MSSMCTCHIDPESCDWCRVQNVKSFCKLVTNPSTFIKDILIVAEQLEERMLKAVAHQIDDWEGGSLVEVPVQGMSEDATFASSHYTPGFAPLRPVDLADSCGGCKFFDTEGNRCKERNIFVKFNSPKCPNWRYFG